MARAMTEPSSHTLSGKNWIAKTPGFLFWALVFGLAYTQAPLYYSNQNQYFLHGLASADLGSLDQDWLVNTADPTLVFSGLVAFTYRFLHPGLFYVYFLLLLGIYFHSLVGIFSFLAGPDRSTGLPRLCFITLFVALHSGVARLVSVRLVGVDYPWYFQAGVAGQYILGFGLQPSAFGVLLVFSVYSFIQGRAFLAVTAAALAGVVHSTYLPGAAFFTLAYMILVGTDQKAFAAPEKGASSWKKALLLGAWALALVLPVVIYNGLSFGPTSATDFAEAQRILVHFRIPHHAVAERWFDGIALVQVMWILAALLVVRRTILFPIMLIPFFLSLVLSMVQVATVNDTLALLFPWRTSAVLVPLATAVMLAELAKTLAPWLQDRRQRLKEGIRWTCIVILVAMVGSGLAINYEGLAYRSNEDELPLLEFVRDKARSGDVYLLPVDVPRLDAGPRGARSTSFTPPPTRGKDQHLVAIDLQRFRLFTGAPIVVDFKSIPYKDIEVIDWRDRLLACRSLYRATNWNDPAIKETLTRYRVSHVVTTVSQDIRCDWLEEIFRKGDYRLYRKKSHPD